MSKQLESVRRWGRGRVLLAASALLLFSLAFAPRAHAAADPLGSGTTALRFEASFLAFLKHDKVKLSALAPARLRAGSLSLPVSGGLIDPTTGRGTIDTEGVLLLSSARSSLPFKQLTVKTKRTPLLAKVGGSQLKLAAAGRISSRRDGFGSAFSASRLTLSAKLATRLNKKLRPPLPFREGQPIGRLLAKTQPLTIAILERGRATLLFAPGFLAKLEALHVSANPIFPAEHEGPSFSFPIIVGGAIAPDASLGTLRTGGDVELLQLGGGQIFWHEFWLDLSAKADSAEANIQPSPPYAGKTGRIPLFDANIAVAAVSSDPKARTIALSGAPLTLQAQTASTLNEAFAEGKELFKPGEVLGTLSFTAQGQ